MRKTENVHEQELPEMFLVPELLNSLYDGSFGDSVSLYQVDLIISAHADGGPRSPSAHA